MSGRSAQTIRRYSVELGQDLVLVDVRKSTFQHLTVNWNFNLLEMAFKTLHFVQGLSRTPLSFIPRYLTTRFFETDFAKRKNLENQQSENLEIQKPRFTNRSPMGPKAVQPEDPKAIHRERPIPIDRNSRERHCIPNRSE